VSHHIFGNGQSISLAAGQWSGQWITFAGTSAAFGQDPVVTFLGNDTIGRISISGTAQTPEYGAVSVAPGVSVAVGGIDLSYGSFAVAERPYGALTVTGTSNITHGSTVTATAYSGVGAFTLDGVMNIDGSSTVNLDYLPINGSGTFNLTGKNALLRMGQVGADTVVKLDGGVLSLRDGMHFLGTITDSSPAAGVISPFAEVDVYNAMDAVRQSYDTTTGMFGLFNAQGVPVANLHFSGTGPLHAFKTSGLPTDHIVISEHPSQTPLMS